ncbi:MULTISPECIES: helix-turn-helix domain-containing protein [Klebsiella]|uniref:helix-turn-helix domain-containing protein n=1 Tax=Klebsiella TaxID=570 RepID=UPI00066567D7|nr:MULTISPECIES: helix-turn-helix domain-containing protein [Klebsiella]MBK4126580.1 helix-turn-helix domain-containing protein [Klebsiella michiganensis]MBZ7455256.1 helix-turn-helix domain-containing protein [Klebsiella michiganensis]MCG2854630.1 helix-turn-helix domain-containing protein [Klebsiella grimontii]MDS7767314.1 helix-turn-helix domain-containing protein [Klebsiella michiganensis]MDS7823901.1 helix-turn-helix domain-containing protein [Klebsiella michiganensis]
MSEKTLGQRILQRRKEIKMTQRELGKAAGVSYATISLWESDNTEPTGKNLHALSRALQCTPTWILFGDSDQTPGDPLELIEQDKLSDDERELVDLYRSLPESEQSAQLETLRARVENFNTLFEELLKARKRTNKK